MSKENTGAKQTQKRCNCLNHRKILRGPCANTTPRDRAQSKGFRGGTEDPAGVMHWHNSFAGEGNRAPLGGLCNSGCASGPRLSSFAKLCLAYAKIKRRINRNKALRYGALGCAVTYRFDDEIVDTPEQKTGRGPAFYIVVGVMLVCLGSGSALVARASGMGLPTLPSFTSSTPSVASAPAPVAAKPVALSDLQALQQQVAGSVQSTERLLAAQQAEIKRLSDQVVVLSGKLDLLQRPLSSAQAALPAATPAPAPALKPAAAKPKKPAAAQSTGTISTGGAPLPAPVAR